VAKESDKAPKENENKDPADDVLAPRRFPLDRVVAIALLVVGGISIFSSLGDYLSMTITLNKLLAELHTQMPEFAAITFTDNGLAQPVGMVIITLEGLIFGLAVWATVRRISAKKLAFWVPIVGYLATSAVVFGGQMICLFSDPAFVEAFWAATQALQAGTATPAPTPIPSMPSVEVPAAPVASALGQD
jgi:hypothetical protein